MALSTTDRRQRRYNARRSSRCNARHGCRGGARPHRPLVAGRHRERNGSADSSATELDDIVGCRARRLRQRELDGIVSAKADGTVGARHDVFSGVKLAGIVRAKHDGIVGATARRHRRRKGTTSSAA